MAARPSEDDILDNKIRKLEEELESLRLQQSARRENPDNRTASSNVANLPLELQEYIRYGRQMIIPQVGLPGQLALKKASVLVIGAGGLGCPTLLYLVGAGIGTVGIADKDQVDLSNLHRQVLHRTGTIGEQKTRSAERTLTQLNPHVSIVCHGNGITPQNAVSIVQQYDIIVDCTDTPSTRYLISDSAFVCGKPLVSGSALGTEGQITVYGYQGGPCYRCVFPNPPPPESVVTCGEGGILGPVVGVIGVMQALEVIKIIVRDANKSKGDQETSEWRPSMTMFAAFDTPQWRSFRLRPRKATCIACGDNPSISRETIQEGDYERLCMRIIPTEIVERVSVTEFSNLKDLDHVLIDVRDSTQFGICSLPNSKNIPYTTLADDPDASLAEVPRDKPVFIVCRFGNDSQLAVDLMKKMENSFQNVRDIKGGLDAWAETFPTDIIPKKSEIDREPVTPK